MRAYLDNNILIKIDNEDYFLDVIRPKPKKL